MKKEKRKKEGKEREKKRKTKKQENTTDSWDQGGFLGSWFFLFYKGFSSLLGFSCFLFFFKIFYGVKKGFCVFAFPSSRVFLMGFEGF